MRSPPISPVEPFAAPVHLVLCDFGKLGSAYVETEPVMTEAAVVEKMLSGEYDRPLEVVAFSVSEGWSRDVSEVGQIVCPECGGDQEHYRSFFPPELGVTHCVDCKGTGFVCVSI
jgi:hypothetical protein